MDIWQRLELDIQKVTNSPFVLNNKVAVGGGDINEAFWLQGQRGGYFVKLNRREYTQMFAAEARGLAELAETGTVKVPEVLTFSEFEQYSYLIMSYLPLHRQGEAVDFARALAQLHLNVHSEFGFDEDNFIGRTSQCNGWHSDWGEFFCHQRLAKQLEWLAELAGTGELVDRGLNLLPELVGVLNAHEPKAALVHGDLWQGNYGFVADGEPVLFDPACYYGDCEVDLAMLELFGEPGDKFFAAYKQVNPIAQGYARRKTIYNLYHILNHVNLFGSGYVEQALGMIEDIESIL